MFASIAFFVVLKIIFGLAQSLTTKSGFSFLTRILFFVIAGFSALTCLFMVTAVTLVGLDVKKFNDDNAKFNNISILKLGWSAWMCVASAVLMAGSAALAVLIGLFGRPEQEFNAKTSKTSKTT
ncbi:CASP-like protein [Caenorhabditis elegans]|uniref:CASP-like protein n=1 Tax=Caenorhabditis elegans TaxID=6239 RepID=Q95YB5_CAEEL|nr:CASP-like protein [Caenorhabditis elegans]CCD70085.1 CASP-like protein [Caenorhabditis elegans]|eukprot:NP_493829.2 Uncharacterized protein CELE_F28A10.3 [Caenorhabditis elegans]